jgi:hypothetical protein
VAGWVPTPSVAKVTAGASTRAVGIIGQRPAAAVVSQVSTQPDHVPDGAEPCEHARLERDPVDAADEVGDQVGMDQRIGGVEDEAVGARTAGQPVGAVTTAERIVARPAGDRVVARQSRQRLAAEIAGDLVVAAGRYQHLGANRRGRPDAAVGKGKLLDLPVEPEITEGVVEEVADPNPVARCEGETHHQVIARARDADVRRPDADVELQRIDLTDGSEVLNDVLPKFWPEDIGIVACIATQRVVAAAATERVVAVAAKDLVGAGAAIEHVGTGVAGQRIVAQTTAQGVVAGRAAEGVVAGATRDAVVGVGVTAQPVVVAGSLEQFGENLVLREDVGALEEANLVDGAQVDQVVGQEVMHDQVIDHFGAGRAGIDGDHQVVVTVPAARQRRVFVGETTDQTTDRTGQFDGVDGSGEGVVLVDDVITATDGELVGVVAGTAIEEVVAGAAAQGVDAVTALQVVVASTADQAVVAERAGEGVVAAGPGERVVARRADAGNQLGQRRGAGIAGEGDEFDVADQNRVAAG